jgi:hypothetical protein
VAPTPPESPDFSIRLVRPDPTTSTFSNMDFVNRRSTQRVDYTYHFEVRPLRTGLLVLPPFTVELNGVKQQTTPQRIQVTSGESRPLLICEVSASSETVYVGQAVDLTLEIWIRKYMHAGRPIGVNAMWQIWASLDVRNSSLGVFSEADLGRPATSEGRRKDEDGVPREFYVYKLTVTRTPTTAGPFDFGAIQFAYTYPVRLTTDVFGQMSLQRSMQLREQPKLPELIVKSIPTEGRPADYNGAVGRYTIHAEARPNKVAVGDPITLTLTVRGAGPFDSLSAPRLDRVPALTKDFEVPAETLAGSLTATGKSFTQTIRPLREDVIQIPPVPMSYFDPATGRFATSLTDPIPIQVVAAERVDPSNLRGSDEPAPRPQLRETTEGLLANFADPDSALTDQTPRIGPIGWGILAALPLVYFSTLIYQWRTDRFRSDVALRRRSRAYSAARKALASNGRSSPDAIASALLGYIADRCNAPAGGLTRMDAVRLLSERSLGVEKVQAVDDLLGSLEQARYGGGPAGDADSYSKRAKQLIDDLESARLR